MKRSEAARYARWSAMAAGILAAITLGVYVRREMLKARIYHEAPPPAPKNVERQSNGLTFSKVDGTRTIFTVNASRSTEFKDKGASLLEDVRITIFGKTGDRHDVIHTQSCQYGKSDGNVVCSGDVQLDMQSAADAARAEKEQDKSSEKIVHVETREVTFNRESGAAHTEQPVKFTFPGGSGNAVGVEYDSEAGTAKLLRSVNLALKPPSVNPAKKKPSSALPPSDVHVQGSSLDFGRDNRLLHLFGPAQAETRTARLTAGDILLELDATFRAQSATASAGANGKRPEVISISNRGTTEMTADKLVAHFSPAGWVEKVDAEGAMNGFRESITEREEFKAEKSSLDVWPRVSQPKELNLSGDVVLKTVAAKGGDSRLIQTTALRMEFSGGKEGEKSKPTHAETLAPGTMEWTEVSAKKGATSVATTNSPVHTKLSADKLDVSFSPLGKANLLHATGNVKTERSLEGKPMQTATANNGTAQIAATGGWTQMDLHGNVKLNEGDRNAESNDAVFSRVDQTATLTGQALVRDATTETHASRIVFSQTTGDIRADGAVRSTDFSSKATSIQLAPAPVNIISSAMQANSKTGRALYTGHARLWQGDSVLEADAIELLRTEKVLNASGNVRAVFPQAPAQPKPGDAVTIAKSTKKQNLWHATAETLTYRDSENKAHLEKNVIVQSADQRIRAASMDLFFTRANGTSGPQQISRAIGTGGVIVEEGARKAIADHGEYSAQDGKFVMTGGNPTLFDGTSGSTTGRQLTFFLADDTIIVDSENGSRVLTKHRVEK